MSRPSHVDIKEANLVPALPHLSMHDLNGLKLSGLSEKSAFDKWLYDSHMRLRLTLLEDPSGTGRGSGPVVWQ